MKLTKLESSPYSEKDGAKKISLSDRSQIKAMLATLAAFVSLCLLIIRIDLTSSRSSDVPGYDLRRALLLRIMRKDHTFTPASSSGFHYVGRWTSSSDTRRRDASFPGSYFDLTVSNASSLYILLANAPAAVDKKTVFTLMQDLQHITKWFEDPETKLANPVKLHIQIDDSKRMHFLSSDGLLCVSNAGLNATLDHHIRVTYAGSYPWFHSEIETGTIQFEGIYLTNGGFLQPSTELQRNCYWEGTAKKSFELVTDFPQLYSFSSDRDKRPEDQALSFTSWQSQLAHNLDVEQITIPAQHTCLTNKCVHTSSKKPQTTTQSLFFRSGAEGTALFSRPWSFETHIPDVLLLDIGRNDFTSTSTSAPHLSSPSALTAAFKTSYITLISSIRKFAYPVHPSILRSNTTSHLSDGYIYNSLPSTLPIFVMLPFSAPPHLAHTLQSVVDAVRKEGDIATFFLDTTGWLAEPDDFTPIPQNITEESLPTFHRRLSAKGSKKAAAFLQMHLCRYLAPDGEAGKCPFQRHDVYKGKVILPQETELDKVVHENKLEKMRAKFGL